VNHGLPRASLGRRLGALVLDAAILAIALVSAMEVATALFGPVLDPPWRNLSPIAIAREVAEEERAPFEGGGTREAVIARETRHFNDGTLRIHLVADGTLRHGDGTVENLRSEILLGRDAGDLLRLRVTQALLALVPFAYFAAFEASAFQATPGKRAFALQVTSLGGRRLSVLHAILRQAAKLADVVACGLGYFLIAADGRRQALHDILARTLVLDARPSTT
jgi:uncharacterized RDD family membrane protein YckC